MGRNAERELERIVRLIGAYLDRAEQDDSLSLSYDAIERATGVSRGHLSRRTDEQILLLVRRIGAIKAARRGASEEQGEERAAELVFAESAGGAASPAPLAGVAAALSSEALGVHIASELAELGRVQTEWLSRHTNQSIHSCPLALSDADVLVRRLKAAVERVRPYVTEWNLRARATSDSEQDPLLPLEDFNVP